MSAPYRHSSRERGKSDWIAAFSVARVALKEGIENLARAHLDGAALDIACWSTTARTSSPRAARTSSACAGIYTIAEPLIDYLVGRIAAG